MPTGTENHLYDVENCILRIEFCEEVQRLQAHKVFFQRPRKLRRVCVYMPPEVAVTPPPPLQVSSAVSRANGQRTYAFNGQRLPKHRQGLAVLREHRGRLTVAVAGLEVFVVRSPSGCWARYGSSAHDRYVDALNKERRT